MILPREIKEILKSLKNNNYQAYIVGGSVRDLLLENPPAGGPIDWDITTNAIPEEIQKIFPDSFYENQFGTVTVKTGSEIDSLKEIEVTTYRTEEKYSDMRHPDQIKYADKIEDDLARRDLTINAIAMDLEGIIIDPYGGREDLKSKLIKTVGSSDKRFREDALRLMRAVRLATTLGFRIEETTFLSITNNTKLLREIAEERIRDEFVKIIESENAGEGMELLREVGLLKEIIPEQLEGVGVGQNLHHIYTVWDHNINALKYTVEKNYSLEIRLAALFHDIAKPRTKRGEGKYSTFYGHDVVGARMTAKIMKRLKFSKKIADKVTKLVRWHLFYYNVDEVTAKSVRRLVTKVGLEDLPDLIKLREGDRIGSGTPKAKPYKLRHLEFMIEKVSTDPISVKMLNLRGDELIAELKLEPGPKVGLILNSLLAKVIDDPKLNTKETLIKLAKKLNESNNEKLRDDLEKIEKELEREEREMKKKYYVH